MARSGDVLEAPSLGITVEFRRTSADTGGDLLEFDTIGQARGFITTPHVHPQQSERHEVVEGAILLDAGGLSRTLLPGETVTTPAGTRHRHRGLGDGTVRIRVQLRPALRTEQWLERIAEIDAAGQILAGWPRAIAGAHLIDDFEGEAYAAGLPPRAQQAFARGIIRVAGAVGRE
jgi:quercetin dioxygenase-like cupin family protein